MSGGVDFVLENGNGKSKSVIPFGLPLDEKRITISRNIDKLGEVIQPKKYNWIWYTLSLDE